MAVIKCVPLVPGLSTRAIEGAPMHSADSDVFSSPCQFRILHDTRRLYTNLLVNDKVPIEQIFPPTLVTFEIDKNLEYLSKSKEKFEF